MPIDNMTFFDIYAKFFEDIIYNIFSLYQAEGLVNGESGAWLCAAILLAGAVLLSALAVTVFRRKELYL